MEAKDISRAISKALKNAMQDGNDNTAVQDLVSEGRVGGDRVNVGSDQWKTGGHCEACRRESYCGTECTARKKLKKLQAERDALKIMLEAFKKAEGEDGNVDAGKEEEKEHNDQG